MTFEYIIFLNEHANIVMVLGVGVGGRKSVLAEGSASTTALRWECA